MYNCPCLKSSLRPQLPWDLCSPSPSCSIQVTACLTHPGSETSFLKPQVSRFPCRTELLPWQFLEHCLQAVIQSYLRVEQEVVAGGRVWAASRGCTLWGQPAFAAEHQMLCLHPPPLQSGACLQGALKSLKNEDFGAIQLILKRELFKMVVLKSRRKKKGGHKAMHIVWSLRV